MLIYIGLAIATFLTTSALSQNIFSINDLIDYSYGNCEYRELENGRVFPEEVTYAPFSRVGYVCNKGYKLLGPQTASCVQGSWSVRLPYCTPSFKPIPPPPTCPYRSLPNGRVVPQKSKYNIGDRVRFSCSSGYDRVGILVSECLDDGRWGSSVPICQKSEKFSNPETYCPMPKFPKGSYSPKPSNGKSYLPGSAIEFTCKGNYYIKGSKTAICLQSGKWNQTPKCETGCKKPVIENGYFEGQLSGLYFAPGQKVTFGCKPTYKIRGEASAICRKNGRWSVKLPICEEWVVTVTESGCPPPVFPYGTYTPRLSGSKTVYSIGDKVVFTCSAQYHVKGTTHAICLASGKWTPFPTCSDECVPPDVANGYVESVSGSFKYTAQISLNCNAGYIAIGPTQATCLRGGVWSAHLRCSDGCYAPQISHMQILPAPINGGNAYEFGNRITFKCDLGYSTSVTGAECRGKNKWDKVLPKCSLLSSSPTSGCRLPELPPGLILKNQKKEVYPFKAQLEFKCMKGYNMIGSAVSICRKHFNGGITGGLDPALPSCEAHKCGSPGKPQNGRFRDGQKDAYYVGDVVHFVCDDRYIMTGSSSITCQENGQFSSLTPTCAPPSCKQGCDYILRRECQCDIKCGDREDCCHDFDQLCRHLWY